MRRAEIRNEIEGGVEAVAAAVRPDNTAEMTTTVESDAIVTTVERGATAGLRATVDDYVVNLDVATRIVQHAETTRDPTKSERSHKR